MAISVPLKRLVYFEAKFATHCVPHFSLFSSVYIKGKMGNGGLRNGLHFRHLLIFLDDKRM